MTAVTNPQPNGNGYVSLSTLVSSLIGITFALATLGFAAINLSQKAIWDKLDAHEKRLDRHDEQIVPWQVHEEKWNAQKAEDDRLQAQIDQTNLHLGDTYTLKDALQDMRNRLERLEGDGSLTKRSSPTGNKSQ